MSPTNGIESQVNKGLHSIKLVEPNTRASSQEVDNFVKAVQRHPR